VQHLGEEDPVRAAADGLGHPALQHRQRVGEQRDAGAAAVHRDAAELVPLRTGEALGEMGLVRTEDVHREAAGPVHGLLGAAVLVEAGQQHRRVHRQRRDRADRHAVVGAALGGGQHHHAAGEVADDPPEDRGVDRGVTAGHQSVRSASRSRTRRPPCR
jgi:hypothetical protein